MKPAIALRKAGSLLIDLRGVSRLAVDATTLATDFVEAMHASIARVPLLQKAPANARTRGLSALVYRSVRGATRLVGGGVDATLARLTPRVVEPIESSERDAALAVLNGVLGDTLAATGNPLALPMRLRHRGKALELNKAALRATFSAANGELVVFVHGLCMNDRQWRRDGHDHGAALARDLGRTPVYVHYNSGLHISDNGRALGTLLDDLVASWPVPVTSLAIVGHSMGGLVARSAAHAASADGRAWLRHLDALVFLGTPHHGAPLERGGHWLDARLASTAYTKPIARLGKLRSAGITDLRYGAVIDTDWRGLDRFADDGDPRRPTPLPRGVRSYAMAATLAKSAGSLQDRLLGDGFVPLASALGDHADAKRALRIPKSRRWVGYGMSHWDLLSRPEAYERLREWLARASAR